jgi:hypothetical protein
MKTKIITVGGEFPGKRLRGKKRYEMLYHYTSFNAFIKIWLSKQFKLSPITKTNDIDELNKPAQVINLQQIPLLIAFADIKGSFKQASFTMDYDSYIKGCMSPMMWGLYADRKEGVCIEFKLDEIEVPKGCIKNPVVYKDILKLPHMFELGREIKTTADVRGFIKEKTKDIFFTKSKCWAGENEFRIISDQHEYISVSNAITAVYLTSFESEECLMVEKLVGDAIPVKFMRYITAGNNYAIPIVTDTAKYRVQVRDAKNNPNNRLNPIYQQGKDYYEAFKHDENASLLKDDYKLNKREVS